MLIDHTYFDEDLLMIPVQCSRFYDMTAKLEQVENEPLRW